MCKIQTTISLKAPIKKVWECITHFEAYPEWNPFLIKVEKMSNEDLHVEMASGKSTMTFKPKITKQEGYELRWLGKLWGISGLFTGEHYFILTEHNKETHLAHGETFSGIFAYLLWPFMKKEIENNFKKMNEALKARVEN